MGKTHLAVALGIEAVRAGLEVRFVDCAGPSRTWRMPRYEQRSTIITTDVGIGGWGRCSGTTWRRARSRTGCATTATWPR